MKTRLLTYDSLDITSLQKENRELKEEIALFKGRNDQLEKDMELDRDALKQFAGSLITSNGNTLDEIKGLILTHLPPSRGPNLNECLPADLVSTVDTSIAEGYENIKKDLDELTNKLTEKLTHIEKKEDTLQEKIDTFPSLENINDKLIGGLSELGNSLKKELGETQRIALDTPATSILQEQTWEEISGICHNIDSNIINSKQDIFGLTDRESLPPPPGYSLKDLKENIKAVDNGLSDIESLIKTSILYPKLEDQSLPAATERGPTVGPSLHNMSYAQAAKKTLEPLHRPNSGRITNNRFSLIFKNNPGNTEDISSSLRQYIDLGDLGIDCVTTRKNKDSLIVSFGLLEEMEKFEEKIKSLPIISESFNYRKLTLRSPQILVKGFDGDADSNTIYQCLLIQNRFLAKESFRLDFSFVSNGKL